MSNHELKTSLEIDVDVTYTVFGKHVAASSTGPEEDAEIEDVKIYIGGIDITRAITPAQMEQIVDDCYTDAEEDNVTRRVEPPKHAMEDR